MVDTVGFVNAVSGAPAYNGRMLRQLNAVGFAGATAARPLGARSGVRPGTSPTTVTATSTTWTCQPFAGLLDGQVAGEAGPYPFSFEAVATGAVTAANASNPRIDIIYVDVDDPSEDASSVPAATRKYLAGTAAATPVAPSAPAGCMAVANINVPKSGGGSPTVTWVAPYCAAAGGVVDFNTKAELDAWTTAPAEQRAVALGTGVEYRRVGGSWKAWSSPWINYTPTLSGLTLGSGGTAVFAYRYVDGDVQVKWKIILGTGGTWSLPGFTLPTAIEAASSGQFGRLGIGSLTTFSAFWDVTINYVDPTTGVRFYSLGGDPATFRVINASAPVAVSAGTALIGRLEYTPA